MSNFFTENDSVCDFHDDDPVYDGENFGEVRVNLRRSSPFYKVNLYSGLEQV